MSKSVPATGRWSGNGGLIFGGCDSMAGKKIVLFCFQEKSKIVQLVIQDRFNDDQFFRLRLEQMKNLKNAVDKALAHLEEVKDEPAID